jgi:predicted DCC family thiol-disulfide oxidoreductase YuxK
MSRVFTGDRFKLLRARLPAKLVVFDGRCLMCHARIAQILERNFFLDDKHTEDNKIVFTSMHVAEGKEIIRSFPSLLSGQDTIIYVERIPSSAGRLQRLSKVRSIGELSLDGAPEASDDIRVSVKSKACLRVMMHLDRFWLRNLGRLGFYTVPRWLGDMVYDAVAARRGLWGTTEQDAVQFPKHIEGLKERTWSGYSRRGTQPIPKANITGETAAAGKPKVSLAPRLK